MAMNVKGGFTYIDMSKYGTFTSGTAKTGQDVSGVIDKLTQYDKPVILYGLAVSVTAKATVTTTYQPILVSFSHSESSGTITAVGTALAGSATLAFSFTSAGSITVTAS